jgi:hypothetical protein
MVWRVLIVGLILCSWFQTMLWRVDTLTTAQTIQLANSYGLNDFMWMEQHCTVPLLSCMAVVIPPPSHAYN